MYLFCAFSPIGRDRYFGLCVHPHFTHSLLYSISVILFPLFMCFCFALEKSNPDAFTYWFPHLFASICILYALNYLRTRVLFHINLHFSTRSTNKKNQNARNKFKTRYKFVICTNLLCRANSLWSFRMTENDVTSLCARSATIKFRVCAKRKFIT